MKRLAYLLVALAPALAHAQEAQCHFYRYTSGHPWVLGKAAAAQQFCTQFESGQGGNSTCHIESCPEFPDLTCSYHTIWVADGTQSPTYTVSLNHQLGDCPEAECETENPDVGTVFTGGNIPGPNTYCNPVTFCRMKVTSRTSETMTIEHSNESCKPFEDPTARAEDPVTGEPETCEAVGDGEYCASATGDGQCGYMNDSFICLGKVKENECKVLGDGGRVCGSKASSTPPAPDNGTPGVPATPDGVIEQERPNAVGGGGGSSSSGGGSAGTYNYYNASTVGNSARDPGTDGAAPSGGSPNGGGNGNGSGDGDGEGGSCEGGGCTGTVPALPNEGTVQSVMSAFWADMQEVPIVEAVDNIGGAFGVGGVCPDWDTEVELYGQSIEANFTQVCTKWLEISPALSMVALVGWGFVAFRILWSA